ncbi:ATP-binding cassette domain-containing protein [Schaalia georgiae]|nr:ATP-binding cassette domain-containing protein [Schaalia georgiae]
MPADPLVDCESLSVHYIGADTWVLDDVSFEQLAGRVTAVIGPSGCGKSTLVRACCGLVPHSIPSEYSGSVALDGQEVADAPADMLAGAVAYVGQNPDAAVVTRSVRSEVEFPLQNLCLGRDEITERADGALAAVGMAALGGRDPWTLSGGQRQRLAIAVALAMRTPLLVLDEPTSTIDAEGSQRFYDLVAGLARQGTAVIVIDHDLDPILPWVDQVLALDAKGRGIAVGTPREVFVRHRAALEAVGVWMPRALRADAVPPAEGGRAGDEDRAAAPRCGESPRRSTRGERSAGASGAAGAALTTAEAGIRVPTLGDMVSPGGVAYWRKNDGQWERVGALDAQDPVLALSGMRVPGRCPRISARVGAGELVGVVGVNGAGKSSLLSALAGLGAFEADEALIGGRPLRRGRHIAGYVFQNPEHQFVSSTVSKELAVGGAPPSRVDELLEQFHLVGHRGAHPLTLSGGQARRLSVATMAGAPHGLVILDEPTYGQDWANTQELMSFIDVLRERGRCVLMATHDLELARRHCTAIIALPDPERGAGAGSMDPERGASTESSDPVSPEARAPGAASPSGSTSPAPGTPAPDLRGRRQGGAFAPLNPLTMGLAALPLMVAVALGGTTRVNLVVMAAATLGVVASRPPARRLVATALAPWLTAALLLFTLRYFATSPQRNIELYYVASPASGATTVGAVLALVLLGGAAAPAEAQIRALTTTLRLPYRLAAAGTAAVSFLRRFSRDFALLRTARALRGVGSGWGPLAPAVRWVASVVPLMVISVSHAERVALSMDARAFGAHAGRTEMVDERWRARDWAVVALALLAAAVVLYRRYR